MLEEKQDLLSQVFDLHYAAWPRFMNENPDEHAFKVHTDLADHQFVVCEPSDTVVAVGNTIPIVWDEASKEMPEGWTCSVAQGIDDYDNKRHVNTLVALAIVIAPTHLGRGLSAGMVLEMKKLAARKGYTRLIAPVRPTLKPKYSLIPMEDYMKWTREDGELLDPWLRIHVRIGGKIMGVCERSMVIEGSVEQWEDWVQMKIKGSGKYIVEGALSPLVIDYEKNWGVYVEPNVWVSHSIP